jgi:hypothetical protein
VKITSLDIIIKWKISNITHTPMNLELHSQVSQQEPIIGGLPSRIHNMMRCLSILVFFINLHKNSCSHVQYQLERLLEILLCSHQCGLILKI